jgi:hypothetical protein
MNIIHPISSQFRSWPTHRALLTTQALLLLILVGPLLLPLPALLLGFSEGLAHITRTVKDRFNPRFVSPAVFSFVQDRPLEICSTYVADRTIIINEEFARIANERATPLSAMRTIARHNERISDLMSKPCRGEWVWRPGSHNGHLFAQIARDLPMPGCSSARARALLCWRCHFSFVACSACSRCRGWHGGYTPH